MLHYEFFNSLLEVRPGSSDLLSGIAWGLTRMKEYEKAAEYGRKAVKQSPGIARYYSYTFKMNLIRLNKWQEWFDIIQEAAEKYGDDPYFLIVLSVEQRAAGNYKDAIITAQRALELKREHWMLASLAISLWMSGDAQSALDKFREARGYWISAHMIVAILKSEGRFGEIESYLESIKEYTPDYASGLDHWASVAGQYYMSMRRFDDALAVYAEYRESGEETWSADNSLAMVECYRRIGAIDSARHHLEELADSSLLIYRPLIFMDLAKLKAIEMRGHTIATELAEQALAEQDVPNDWVTQPMLLAQLRFRYAGGNMDDIEKTLEELQSFTVQSAIPYRKAQIAAVSGSINAGLYLDQAILNLTRLSRGEYIYTGGIGVLIGEASAYRALALARAGKPVEAACEIKRAIKLEPEREDIAYNVACAYSLNGDTALALQ